MMFRFKTIVVIKFTNLLIELSFQLTLNIGKKASWMLVTPFLGFKAKVGGIDLQKSPQGFHVEWQSVNKL